MLLRPLGDDRFELRLTPAEVKVVGQLCRQLRARIEDEPAPGTPGAVPDPDLRRLSPPAHPHDPDEERAYRQVVGDDLRASRLADLDLVVATTEATELGRDQLEAWARAFNALRLALGTSLDVGEDRSVDDLDPDDPRLDDHLLYDDLTTVVALVVHTLQE